MIFWLTTASLARSQASKALASGQAFLLTRETAPGCGRGSFSTAYNAAMCFGASLAIAQRLMVARHSKLILSLFGPAGLDVVSFIAPNSNVGWLHHSRDW
ncbi:hypothetical protein JIR23_06795 [Bradyrhizobium diazoefficiens]|nr:hypothetical protein [Bradyrhizobium diazoefficiens]QQN65454.1 hypothetical protein JIR23_06795 [Bradyrhizobium diazoefficiens]